MEARGSIFAAASIVITVQIGLFAWVKADIAGLTERVDRVERGVAFVRGQLSLVLPALGGAFDFPSRPMTRRPWRG